MAFPDIGADGVLHSLNEGSRSGRVKNCFIRLDDKTDPPGVEIYFPERDDEDMWFLREIFDNNNIRRDRLLDSGARFSYEKKISPETVFKTIEQIARHFEEKYPRRAVLFYDRYSCGHLSEVTSIHVDDSLVFKYCQELRRDFVKNYLKVIFDGGGNVAKIYINTYDCGTLEYKNGVLEMHRWENEDEAQSVSYLSRRYTMRIQDGFVSGDDVKQTMIGTVRSSMEANTIAEQDRKRFDEALTFLETER
ncbi:MAG: hypothetical protein LBH35_02740 [Treponema sp.]|jgi:hypothetical protein|nr:hypothetical protein [Treponema sp.]